LGKLLSTNDVVNDIMGTGGSRARATPKSLRL